MKFNEYKIKSILEVINNDIDRAYQLSDDRECDSYLIAAMNKLGVILDIVEFDEEPLKEL